MEPVTAHTEHRLPTDVKPIHYDLTIRTDLEELKFDGSVKIDLQVIKETSTLTFNSSNLNIGNVVIHSSDLGIDQEPSSHSFDSAAETYSVKFSKPLPAGSNARLDITFDALLKGDLMGYYYSTWVLNGKKQIYTLTQFEATAARRTFPCWDEPLLKATYSITMISRSDTVNLSNMPVVSEEEYKLDDNYAPGKWKITRFQRTPLVSSYLIAFANGNFDYIEDFYTSPVSGKTIPLRIYSTSDNIHQAHFALEVKKKTLPLYEKLFKVEYPLPKLDTLVVNDFDTSAMENWGLITGRTTAFCIDPQKVGVAAQKNVASTQSHEVAHMWFGNITTMAWWDNLYLNEGFATLMGEVIVLDKLFPEWKLYSEFITVHLNDALQLDAKLSSHPIEVECPDANKIDQIFDSLSYSKAASVLRMLSAYVGEEKFLEGVSIYLRNHLYGNSVTKDLWDGIAQATGIDVAKLMENWVTKIGFPVLTVTEGNGEIRIRQDRFLDTGPADEKLNQTLWSVPLGIKYKDESGAGKLDNNLLLEERERVFTLDNTRVFKLNADTSGVYRVLYSIELLQKIITEAAKKNSIYSLSDRIGLVHDTFSLGTSGFTKLSSAFSVVQALRNEEEFLVWQGIREQLESINGVWWEDEHILTLLSSFNRELYGPLVKRLGYENKVDDSADTQQLRALAVSAAASAEDESVVHELKKRFDVYLETGVDSGISLDLERVTYRTAVKYGGRKEYDAMKEIYIKPRRPTSRTAAISAMCSSRDEAIIKETFGFMSAEARDQDVFMFFGNLAANRSARRLLAEFMKHNYESIYKRFSGNTMLPKLIESSFAQFTTERDATDVEDFFKVKDTSKFDLALSQALDAIRARSALIHRSSDDLSQWLEKWERDTKV